MSARNSWALACTLCVGGAIPGIVAAQPAAFRGLGFVPGTERASAALALSSNGRFVAGWCDVDAVRWSSSGVETLGRLASPFSGIAVAYGVSRDGSIVVGFGRGEQVGTPFWAFAWEEGRGMLPLCPPPDQASVLGSYASGLSEDGRVIVGASDAEVGYPRACRATPEHPWAPIADDPSSASSVSADGTVVVGIVNTKGVDRAFAWSEKDAIRLLPDLPGGSESAIAYAANRNGTIVVGGSASGSSDPDYAYEAVRWTASGEALPLGDLPGGDYSSEARGVSDDGSIIVGLSSVAPAPRTAAFIWDAEHGMRDLRSVLMDEYQLDLAGWELSTAQAISGDGRTIVGRGTNPKGEVEGWMARLGPVCAADWNADGVLDVLDVTTFVEAFLCEDDEKSCPSADFNDDGTVDTRDFFAFLIAFFNGCS